MVKKRCRYCDEGRPVEGDGCHWIVTSIRSPMVKAVRCPNAAPADNAAMTHQINDKRGWL